MYLSRIQPPVQRAVLIPSPSSSHSSKSRLRRAKHLLTTPPSPWNVVCDAAQPRRRDAPGGFASPGGLAAWCFGLGSFWKTEFVGVFDWRFGMGVIWGCAWMSCVGGVGDGCCEEKLQWTKYRWSGGGG